MFDKRVLEQIVLDVVEDNEDEEEDASSDSEGSMVQVGPIGTNGASASAL